MSVSDEEYLFNKINRIQMFSKFMHRHIKT